VGMIYRKQYTMPLPIGAEIVERDGQRIARWRLRNGQLRSAEVVDSANGKLRVRGQSKFHMARYRDARGDVVEVSTNCKDAVAARAVLAKLERQAELIRAGVLSDEEVTVAEHASQPLSKNLDDYERHLRAKSCNPRRVSMVRRRLERLVKECRFTSLTKMSPGPVEQWLVEQADLDLSAATRNSYRESAVCFGNWCRRTGRLTCNPFEDVPRADAHADRKHQRRALTEEELLRLLEVARLRPLAEHGRAIIKTDSRNKSPRSRATWRRELLTYDDLEVAVDRARETLRDNPALITKLERTGRERALIYKTLALTGLRKGELASITVAQLEFDGPVAYIVLCAADEKNRKGSNIPVGSDLASELSSWMSDRLDELQYLARCERQPVPARLPPATPLFDMPSGLTRIFNRDLVVANIPKRDERNRVIDVHALRVSFGTHLCAAGVPLRTVQAAMRHSKPELTANIYTDPKLLDVAGALEALPSLSTPALRNAKSAVGQ